MARGQLATLGPKLSRQLIVVIGCFLLGVAVAAVISSAATARTAPRVSDADYVLMVADIFDHEKSVFNARERLLVIGKNPVDLADAAVERAQRDHPDAKRDVDSLKQLAQALRQADAEAGATRSSSSPGLLGLVGVILASVVLAAGAAWIWKQLETRGAGVPRIAAGRTAATRLRESQVWRLGPRQLAAAFSQVGAKKGGTATLEEEDAADVAPSRARPSRLRPTRAGAEHVERPSLRRAEPASASRVELFEARYELGEEEYDEVHPVRDAHGEVIGAIGLSATEPTGDRPGRFYGFTAWLQAYGVRQELAAVGLVTRTGQLARSAAIAEWERRGTIDAVETADRGRQLELEAAGLRARLTIVDFDYAAPSPGSPGYFGYLVVQYEVEPS
jgi:hypothetical protein